LGICSILLPYPKDKTSPDVEDAIAVGAAQMSAMGVIQCDWEMTCTSLPHNHHLHAQTLCKEGRLCLAMQMANIPGGHKSLATGVSCRVRYPTSVKLDLSSDGSVFPIILK